jgi:hypothetical protein
LSDVEYAFVFANLFDVLYDLDRGHIIVELQFFACFGEVLFPGEYLLAVGVIGVLYALYEVCGGYAELLLQDMFESVVV